MPCYPSVQGLREGGKTRQTAIETVPEADPADGQRAKRRVGAFAALAVDEELDTVGELGFGDVGIFGHYLLVRPIFDGIRRDRCRVFDGIAAERAVAVVD